MEGRPRRRGLVLLVLLVLGGIAALLHRWSERSAPPSSTALPNAQVAAVPTLRPSEVPPAPAPPPASTPAGIVVRRIYDGAAVGGIVLRVLEEGPTVVADGEGVVDLPAPALARAVPDGFRWKAARQTSEEIRDSGTYWVYDMVSVRVEVDSLPRGSPGEAEDVAVTAMAMVPVQGEGPRTIPWLHAHGLQPSSLQGNPVEGEAGAFRVLAPRLPSISVFASRKGWRPASANVEVAPDSPEEHARLTLTPGLRLEGVIRDEHGQPVANAEVHAFVVRWFPWDRSRDGELVGLGRKLSPNGGIGMNTTRDGRLFVRVHEVARTDAEGRFAIYTKSEGRIGLYVHETGRRAVRRDLGEVTVDGSGIELSVPTVPDGPFVRFVSGGEALAKARIVASDTTDPLKPCPEMRLDDLGRVPADWLQSGHFYYLRILGRGPGLGGFLRWEGQEVIDLASLPSQPPADLE